MEQGEMHIHVIDEESKPGALKRAINEYYEHKTETDTFYAKYPELAAIREEARRRHAEREAAQANYYDELMKMKK